jgi:hypothetical protein
MAHDPIADAALGQLRDILQWCLQVADVVGAAVDALEEQAELQTETTGRPPEPPHEVRASVEQSPELQTVLAFRQRLSEVFGVATVTFEGSADHGYRFLVEMAEPA